MLEFFLLLWDLCMERDEEGSEGWEGEGCEVLLEWLCTK